MPSQFLELAVPVHLWGCFDYLPPPDAQGVETWPPGIRIQVPFGSRSVVGILLSIKEKSEVPIQKLKPALKKIDDHPIMPPSLFSLCQWASDYYQHPLGEVLAQALPKALRQGRAYPQMSKGDWASVETQTPDLKLNENQQEAVAAITKNQGFRTFLLDGVTGSGKTEVYFQSISPLVQQGKQVLVLIPEISLAPQTVERFQRRFRAPVVLLHSEISDKKKLMSWIQAKQGNAAIIIGTRSAIFAPLLNPGMIILDEEHDLSFKQQSNFRYSARDLAIVRGQLENIPVILGSATPSLESFFNARQGKYTYLPLPQRAGIAQSPQVKLIDLRGKRLTGGLSAPLLEKITEHLSRRGQILLFINRRGYAPVLMCHHCGWMAKCTRCDARFTLHLAPQRLHCHHCGIVKKYPVQCEQCRQSDLIHVGKGTERIEETIKEIFPGYPCVRIDGDSTKQKGSIEKLLTEIHEQKAPILIGTQMLAKGHHFDGLTLVAVVDADSGLFSADFRGVERMAQLLVQVGGRAGRAHQLGEVIIQTHHPDHPHLQLLLNEGYQNFARALLLERRQAELPPFTHLALLRAESNRREWTQDFLSLAKSRLENMASVGNINLLGPIPAPMERCAGRYRGQLLLQAAKRLELQEILRAWVPTLSGEKATAKVRWSVDIDPQELL